MKIRICGRLFVAGMALAMFGLFAIRPVHAASVFDYQFPASWDGDSETITDLSGAGNHAVPTGAPLLSTNVPPGAPVGANSLNTVNGGARTFSSSLLSNAAIAAAGGYRIKVHFYWDRSDNSRHIQKIVDYAGTEFLQLHTVDADTAFLRFGFNDDPNFEDSIFAVISPNQWYDVSGVFLTHGNAVGPDGSLTGEATLTVDGESSTISVVKTAFGDSLDRRIGIGTFSGSSGKLLEFHGDIFNPSVELVPEPATTSGIAWIAAIAVFLRRRR